MYGLCLTCIRYDQNRIKTVTHNCTAVTPLSIKPTHCNRPFTYQYINDPVYFAGAKMIVHLRVSFADVVGVFVRFWGVASLCST